MTAVLCNGCGSDKFRASHFRLKDLRQLLMLRRPLRCRICSERVYVFIPQAKIYKPQDSKKS